MRKSFVLSTLVLALVISGCATVKTDSGEPLWEAGAVRDKIVVISDLHLGIDDTFAETVSNKPFLVEFLRRLEKTKDVRELVIAGDFLDSWYLPVSYPAYSDEKEFFAQVIANNSEIIQELFKVIKSGIRLIYVYGNHDMTLEAETLLAAIPGIEFVSDAKGLGRYYTGDRNEIAIEHGHRYDVFSAPDSMTNAELCQGGETILPAGYFYARYAATWVAEGRPHVEKDLPGVGAVPSMADADQFGAYVYYSLLHSVSQRMTPEENLEDKIFDMRIAGFNDTYSYLDFFPCLQPDGTISAPVLYRNIQRTWGQRQKVNEVRIPNDFIKAASGAVDWDYYATQAGIQYLDNPEDNVQIVVFGHTHVPTMKKIGDDGIYINSGTWIDHNTDFPEATRTFAVIATGETDTCDLYMYGEDGSLVNVGQ